MLRFKLANGGTIASCKQPLQNKDFDRIICNNCNANQYQYTYIKVSIINPSTHLLHKSYNGELYLMLTPVARSNKYFPYKGKTINCIPLRPLSAGSNIIELYEQDMVGWIRDNIKLSNMFEFEHIREGLPWEPGSHNCYGVRSKIARLTYGETESEGSHGYVYNGKLAYGFEYIDEEHFNYVYVRDQILVSIWKWNGNYDGLKHIRHILTGKPKDVYLSYLDLN